MNKITLVGPNQIVLVGTNDKAKFNKFIDWLKEYNPTEILDLKNYHIKNEKRLVMAKLKAKRLGLTIF